MDANSGSNAESKLIGEYRGLEAALILLDEMMKRTGIAK